MTPARREPPGVWTTKGKQRGRYQSSTALGVSELAGLLDSPEISALVSELEATRWTGRPGYPIRAMVGMALVKSLYVIPTWSRTARLVAEHPALQAALGCVPSVYACYRFTAKLRHYSDRLDACIGRV